MNKEGKIGVREAITLLVITITTKVFYSSPAVFTSLVGNAAWYVVIISGMLTLICFLFISNLCNRFPEKDLAEIFKLSLGKFIGSLFSLVLAFFLLFIASSNVAEFHEIMRVYVFPLTPDWFIITTFILSVFAVSLTTLEGLARFAKLFFGFMVFALLLLMVLNIPNYDISYIFPILGHGPDKILKYGLNRTSGYGEVIILAVFASSFQGSDHIKKEGIWSLIISTVFISLSFLTYSLVFPYYTAQEIVAPMYEYVRMIDFGRFMQRIESLFLFIWIIGSIISTTTIFYSFVHLFSETFTITDKKPIVISSTILLFSMCFLHQDISGIIYGTIQTLRSYGWIPLLGLPFLAYIAAIVRKKGEKYEKASE